MLAQEVVKRYPQRARFAVQDLGASPLADRLGIDKYPAIFVDDALVARPEDFYAWGGPPTGRYLPWDKLESRRHFQRDLQKMIEIRLTGGAVPSVAAGGAGVERHLPAMPLHDLEGRTLRFSSLRGKPVVVEFWATWCPFCIDTLTWLKELPAGDATVIAVAVDSERKDIDTLVARYKPPGVVVIGEPELRAAFDGPPAVPTLLIADRDGRIVRIFYGAPKDLHEQISGVLATLNHRGS